MPKLATREHFIARLPKIGHQGLLQGQVAQIATRGRSQAKSPKLLYKCPPNVGSSVAVVDELLEDSCPLVAVVEELSEDNCPNPPSNIWTIVPTHRQISGGSGIRIWRTFVYLQPPKHSADSKQTADHLKNSKFSF